MARGDEMLKDRHEVAEVLKGLAIAQIELEELQELLELERPPSLVEMRGKIEEIREELCWARQELTGEPCKKHPLYLEDREP